MIKHLRTTLMTAAAMTATAALSLAPGIPLLVLAFAWAPQAEAQPAARRIYPAPERAAADLAAALKLAAARHRHVLLDFGGDWCTDCQVLDLYFHDRSNKPILDSSYVLVHVNIGHMDQNLDIADRYEIPLKKGVPALAVLDSNGRLLYSQKTGEFEAMRHLQSSAVTEFLNHWKPNATT